MLNKVRNLLFTVSSFIQVIFLPLNIISGFGAVIWVGIVGELSTAFYSALILIFSPFFLALPLAVGMILILPGILFLKIRGALQIFGYIFASPFIFLGALWNWFVMAAWGVVSFGIMFRYLVNDNHLNDNLLPYSLLAYGMATSPWFYMQSKEASMGGEENSGAFHILFIQIASAWSIYDMNFASQKYGVVLIWILVMGTGVGLSMILGGVTSVFDKMAKKAEVNHTIIDRQN